MCVLSSPMLDGYLKPPSPVSRDRLSFCLADMEMPALPACLACCTATLLSDRSGKIWRNNKLCFFFWQKKAPLRCANPGICTAAFPATWVDSARPTAYHGHCCAHLPNPTSGSHAQGEGAACTMFRARVRWDRLDVVRSNGNDNGQGGARLR